MKNAFINIALPFWLFSEPQAPMKNKDQALDKILQMPTKAIPPNWTTWDIIEIQGPITFGQLEEQYKQKYGVVVNMVSYENLSLYVAFQKNHVKERRGRDIGGLIEEL